MQRFGSGNLRAILSKSHNNIITINYHSILFTHQQYQYGSLQMNELHDTPKGYKPKRPKGRGPNNKPGVGHKGSKVRQGNRRQSHRGFEGGQTPIHIMSPRIGWHKFDHRNGMEYLFNFYLLFIDV